jgi:diguanylate cyclase (GGDEF)-like protein
VRAPAPAPAAEAPGPVNPPHGLPIPFTPIVLTSPLDVALAAALASLPLLFGVWLLVFGRTLGEARRAREAQLRFALAADLGLRPRELTSLTTKALFKLREQAAFDDLTGALRRGAGIAAVEREIARARRHKSPLTVVFVDIDGLKVANDRRGHAAGDKLIRALAQALKQGLRDQDLLLRYGGDEFVCVLPDTPAESGRAKLRAVHAAAAKAGVRFSVGLAELERSDDVVSLLARADRELYVVKARRGEIVQMPPGQPSGGKRRRISA